jgi:transmembrane 9 superfamily protein 2/4
MVKVQFKLQRLVLLLLVRDCVNAVYYVPGINPRYFSEGDEVPLMVNTLTSIKTHLPMDYYNLPFCRPDSVQIANENIGQVLSGDLIQNSPYKLLMKQEMFCEQVCISHFGQGIDDGTTLVDAIRDQYQHNWMVDNLPAASKTEDENTITTRYWGGFPVGYVDYDTKKVFINNHVNIEIMYHRVETVQDEAYRVVRFTVEPFSIKHDLDQVDINRTSVPVDIKNPIASCDLSHKTKMHTDWDMVTAKGQEPQETLGLVLFTYDVTWVENRELHWAHRWDVYFTMDNAIPYRVHWFSLLNSLVAAVLVSALVIVIWKRMVRDISNYRQAIRDGQSVGDVPIDYYCVDGLICLFSCGVLALFWFCWEWLVGARINTQTTTTTQQQVRGWKAVQADVFRPPSMAPMLLSTACGTGAQLLCTAFLTIFISLVGFVNPARRGWLLITVLFLFVLMGVVCGYVTSRLYKAFGGQRRRLASSVAALGFPGLGTIVFAAIYWASDVDKSTYAVGSKVWYTLGALWWGFMTPLVFLGSYLGYRQSPIQFPVEPSATPRPIPGNPCVRNFAVVPISVSLCGILPFGSVFVELYFILASTWFGQYYYAFGFLLLVFGITIITCAVITILFTYLQLRLEDYHWWWRSFLNGGSMALYVFLYSIIYGTENELDVDVLFIGYMAMVSLSLYCMMGFVGVCASLLFTKMVFAAGEHQETDQPLVRASKEVELALPAVV